MTFDTIYSLGSRCQNALILKKYGYRDFSGIFDYLNTDNIGRVLHILKDDFNELFNPENNVRSSLGKKRVRTLNRFYDNIKDFHSATLCHHDLTNESEYQAMLSRKERFKKLKNFNVLYNYTYNTWENNITKDHMLEMVDIIKNQFNNKNFKICFVALYLRNNKKFLKVEENKHYDVFHLNINSYTGGDFSSNRDCENFMKIILSYDIKEPRLKIEEIDAV